MPAPSLGQTAYERLRDLIVRLDYAPGDVLREDEICERIGIGRTPVREALLRLAREHFVTVMPRKGMFVAGIDVSELALLFETRTVLEPYAARLAAARGTPSHWDAMAAALDDVRPDATDDELMDVDRRCHTILWDAAGNRFLLDSLDTLYAQSDRLWHLHLADVAYLTAAIEEHHEILDVLRSGDGERAAALLERHVRAFDTQIRAAVTRGLEPPLAG